MSTKTGMYKSSFPRGQHNALKGSQTSRMKQRSVRFLSIKPDPYTHPINNSLNFFYDPVIDERPLVQDNLRRTSIVYAKTCGMSQPSFGSKLGQRQVTQLRLKDWERYQWTLPPVPACRRPWPSPTSPEHPSNGSDRGSSCGLRGSLSRRESETTTLPPLPRSDFGQPMLRRPTRRFSLRTGTVGDEVLDMLGNYLDLRPIADHELRGHGRRHSEGQGRRGLTEGVNFSFYAHHFPLLLRKKRFKEEDSDDNKVVSHRQILGRQTSEQKRRLEVSRRCNVLERALTSLEQGWDELEGGDHCQDGVFITELREDTFDPRLWPWNTERYVITTSN